jgi:hypothetical protein
LPEKQTAPKWPEKDLPGRLSGDFRIHKLEKIGGGKGKRKYPTRQCKVCAARKKQSETRYICKFRIVLLHKGSCFEKYHSVMKYETIYMQFLQSGAQERNLQCQKVNKNMLWGGTFNVFKTSGNWGCLIKCQSGRQCVVIMVNLITKLLYVQA